MKKRTFLFNTLLAAAIAVTVAISPASAENKSTKDKPAQVLIVNVDVWDGTSEALKKGVDVLVEGNKIKKIAKGIKAPNATTINGQGGTLTPGLIDMHQHLTLNGGTAAGNNWDAYVQGAHASRAAEYLLRSGFTTIRDIAGNSIGLKKAINEGKLPGPRVYTSGPAIGPTGGHSDWRARTAGPDDIDYQMKVQQTHVVDGRADWLKVSRWNLRNGADFLKVMAGGGVASEFDPRHLQSPSPEEMEAAVQAASEYGTYVAIHAYTDDAYLKSIKAGVRSFEHGFLTTEKSIKELKKADAWWSIQPYGGYTTLCGEFPDWYSDDMKKKAKMVCTGVKNTIKLMKKYKIKTFNGSDMFGWDNWDKALINVTTPTVDLPEDIRYTSLESMKMSTSAAGQFLREETNLNRNDFIAAKLGVVEEGAWADILIWNGDPTKDIKLILKEPNLKMVMKDGKVYKNLLVDPTHESFRAAPAPSGHSFNM